MGGVAGAPALVGKAVVALFRACGRDELFGRCPVIITDPFRAMLHLQGQLHSLAANVNLDTGLPPMTFYRHPALEQP